MSKDETPFGYVLGKDIEALPEPLRQFLSRTDECRYVGTCAVTRGSSKFSKLVGVIMRLPRAGTDMPFELTTQMAGDSILWRRSFNGKALTTRARIAGKRGQKKLMEKAGAATLFMRMAIESDQLVFRSVRAKFLGIPLPGFIAPRVEAFGFVEADNFVI
jgi:hypothetical protein